MTSEPIAILAVPGTWARKNRAQLQWFDLRSPLHAFLNARGFCWLRGADGREFEWTTDVNGASGAVWRFILRKVFRRQPKPPECGDWEVGGVNLYAFLVPPLNPAACWPGDRTHILAHSHGLQVVLHAAARGLRIRCLLSVCSPVRADMMPIAHQARENIDYWIHFYSDGDDRMQVAGAWGDGDVGIVRQHPLADENIYVPGGHSSLLNHPVLFDLSLRPALETIRRRHGQSATDTTGC